MRNLLIIAGAMLVANATPGLALELGGRIHLDVARTENTEGQAATDNEVRRAYLTLKHDLTSSLKLKVQADVSDGDLDAKDVYLQWQDQDGNAWYLGQFKQFYSLDTLTSDNNITFLERALPTTLSIDRRLGLGTRRHFSDHHFAMSVYGDSMDGDDQGIGAVSRWHYAPVQEGTDIWHLGASLGWEEVRHGWRVKSRPENHLANTLYQASPTVSGQQSIVRANAEWAMQRGSMHTQAEVFYTKAQDGMRSTGGYWQAGWFVSEDTRAYSHKSGYWKSTTPSQNYGAIELTARLSYLDVQNALPTDLSGLGLTVGLNWTFHEHARMLVNHSRHHRHTSPTEQSVEATMVRFQWTF